MAESAQGHVSVKEGETEILREPLSGGRMVVGRSADVEVTLPANTVSREHAEIFADPFGRWWVRDLGSRNGTAVNGTTVDEHLLEPDDTIQIEQFTIAVELAGAPKERPRRHATTVLDAGLTIADSAADRVSRLADMETPKIDASHLSMLTEFSTRLLATEADDERLCALCELMVDKPFNGNTAMAMRLIKADSADQDPQILCQPVSARNWRADEQPYISRTMLRAMRAGESPIVASNVSANAEDVVEMSLAADVMEMAAVMCPIRSDAEALDVLYVSFPAAYATGEWLALTALACDQYQQAETAWQARLVAQEQAIVEKELERAQRIQLNLIPRDVKIDGLDAAIGFEPCRWVGGDYVDVVPMPDGRIFLTVCDVCGKGIQAALITASLHTCVHMTVQSVSSLTDIMVGLNQYLCDTLPDESFVTAVSAIIDHKTGALEYINAGHPPAMIVDPQAKVRHLASGQNPPLGYLPVPFESEQTELGAGELLAMFTDGYTELPNEAKQLLGIEGIDDCLAQIYKSGDTTAIAEVSNSFERGLTAHQGTALPEDDLTFLLVRRA